MMSSRNLKNVVESIAHVEEALAQVEIRVNSGGIVDSQVETDNIEVYELGKNRSMLMHKFVELGKLLDALYRLRRLVLTGDHAAVGFKMLTDLYSGAFVLAETKKEFPPDGVYVDLAQGRCADSFHLLFEKIISKRENIHSPLKSTVSAEYLDPFIELLGNYESPLEERDAKAGIYNGSFFEEFCSPRWKLKADEPDGHYEMRNSKALAVHSYISLSSLLPILYSWRIYFSGNWLSLNKYPGEQLRQLVDNPLDLLKDPKSRFPDDGVYIDLTWGLCSDKLLGLLRYGGDQKSVLEVTKWLEDESVLDDPKYGIHDRAHFEKFFSAKWIPDN